MEDSDSVEIEKVGDPIFVFELSQEISQKIMSLNNVSSLIVGVLSGDQDSDSQQTTFNL